MRRLTQNIQKHLRQRQLVQSSVQKFGGAPAGEIRPEDIKLNPLNFLNDTETSLISLNGFQDVNVKSYPDDTDPYAHLRNAPFFSFERLYFSDPYFHSDDHEALMNEPHGYVTNDDPLDTRNNVERSYMELLFYFSGAVSVGLMLGFSGIFQRGHSTDLFDANLTAELMENEIREIRKQNYELEQRKAQLLEQLQE